MDRWGEDGGRVRGREEKNRLNSQGEYALFVRSLIGQSSERAERVGETNSSPATNMNWLIRSDIS